MNMKRVMKRMIRDSVLRVGQVGQYHECRHTRVVDNEYYVFEEVVDVFGHSGNRMVFVDRSH